MSLPPWSGLATAAPIGVLVTGADLPNAFPYPIAIERLTTSEVSPNTGIVVLATYTLVYCRPCLLLLAAHVVGRDRITVRLQRVYDRLGTARTQPQSLPVAVFLLVQSATIAAIELTP